MSLLQSIQRELTRTRSPSAKLVWSLVAAAVPTAIRWTLDQGMNGVPFVTYFPAVFLAGLFLGWRYSLLVIGLSALAARLLFLRTPDLEYSSVQIVIIAFFLVSCALLVVSSETLRQTVISLQRRSDEAAERNVELHHRVGNLLTVAHALAAQTFRYTPAEQFVATYGARLQVLQKANKILSQNDFCSVELGQIVAEAIAPFDFGNNISVGGPPVTLPEISCIPLTLALHELATNAVKYGALSVSSGKVELAWHLQDDDRSFAVLSWQESGGPPVLRPRRKGLGTRLLSPKPGLHSVELRFDAEGVVCVIHLALASDCESPEANAAQ